MLKAIVTRVNTLEAANGFHAKATEELKEEIKGALATTDKKIVEGDKAAVDKEHVLRGELSAMATKLEDSNTDLMKKLAALEASVVSTAGTATAPPLISPPGIGLQPNLEKAEADIKKLQAVVEDAVGKLTRVEGGLTAVQGVVDAETTKAELQAKHQDQVGARVNDLEMGSKLSLIHI